MTVTWHDLAMLSERFAANAAALATRDPALAAGLRALRPEPGYFVATQEHAILIGRGSMNAAGGHRTGAGATAVTPLTVRLPPAAAEQVAARLCPAGKCADAILIAGVEQGWLWDRLYRAPCDVPARPGHRPPLYFLSASLDDLWVAMHLQDWRDLLADPRVRLAGGPDAVAQLRAALSADPRLAAPRLCVTLDPRLWAPGEALETLTADVNDALRRRLAAAHERLKALYAGTTDAATAARLRQPGGTACRGDQGQEGPGQRFQGPGSGVQQHSTFNRELPTGNSLNTQHSALSTTCSPLRVLGVTSRFTTFLQHSMRDWLAAFAADGHETRLAMEEADHENMNSLVVAETCAEFRPDLVLLIDHHRGEVEGLPERVPCAMWVQDYLPALFSPAAGAAQGPYDFVLGYNRTECTTKFGYPFERFLPAMVVVNEDRFAPPELTADDRRRYGCDVCFVSHASKPAERILAEQTARADPRAKVLLTEAFQRLRAVYEQGACLTHPLHLRAVIDQAVAATGLVPTADSRQALLDLFTHRINNALLRHQALEWAARSVEQTGATMHLYGNGWEAHPTLGRYARGPADNQAELRKIYAAARIHLQATPHGAVHQRLLEGLAAGAFFLIRHVPGDLTGRLYQPLWEWCRREGIETDEQILQHATPEIWELLGQIQRTLGLDPFRLGMRLVDDLRTHADLGFTWSASSLWPDEYDRVAFDSEAALARHLRHFLAHDQERRDLAAAMRRTVLERLTYRATNARLLDFIAAHLERRAGVAGQAA